MVGRDIKSAFNRLDRTICLEILQEKPKLQE